jgi:UDP-2,3-diacylglucosamine hydrolase
MRVLFASDLHLAASRPGAMEIFRALMEKAPGRIDKVYLLGDLVEFWMGDDDDDPIHRQLVASLRALTHEGVGCDVMTGNRDFLMQAGFANETGVDLLPDFKLIELGGIPTLLTHGDLLCIRDVQYQQFRAFVRAPERQASFLALSLDERRKIATSTRADTQKSMSDKDDFIMDVDPDEVVRVMSAAGARRLIHGHTHRPGIHTEGSAGYTVERVVLGDWYAGDLVYVHDGVSGDLISAAELIRGWS